MMLLPRQSPTGPADHPHCGRSTWERPPLPVVGGPPTPRLQSRRVFADVRGAGRDGSVGNMDSGQVRASVTRGDGPWRALQLLVALALFAASATVGALVPSASAS